MLIFENAGRLLRPVKKGRHVRDSDDLFGVTMHDVALNSPDV
jgi:hypothetical protein